MRTRWLALLIVLAPLFVPAPASALSCVPFSEQKPHSSFAGTIVQQRGDAYLFVVREVWSGPDLDARTWIAFDDLWHEPIPGLGEAWVVYADGSWRANTCTVTPDRTGAEALRPEKVRKPTPTTWWSAIRTSLISTWMLVPVPVNDER
ncbi:hypothetical protein [Aeromicrobium sp.]|uniref:hypothetical protein n=1 Tax=Aeromicrobium sp. TaxID=1871063 RepID=UPI002FC619C1